MNKWRDRDRMNWIGRWLGKGIVSIALLSLLACQGSKQSEKTSDNPTQSAEPKEARLVLNNATLEQSNAKGEILWKIQVDEAAYSPDRRIAHLTKVRGNLFHEGKIVLQVSSNKGEIYKGGEEIFLKENIVATDPRNGAVLRSEEVEWRPNEALLMARKNFRGTHPKLNASANEGKYYTREQRLELIGKIIATAPEPKLQLKTEHLLWTITQQKVVGDRPLEAVRYQDKTVTDRLVANRANIDLNTKIATLQENIEFKSIDPPVQIAGDVVVWNYKERQMKSDKPVRLVQYVEQLTITGNRAQVDLNKKVAYLQNGVQGVSSGDRAKLYANELTWNMPTRIVEATGNVIYEQADPKFNVTGDKAVGTLQNNQVVVSSNSRDRVVTEIFPE